jgi:SAM-dependent methyltransferase
MAQAYQSGFAKAYQLRWGSFAMKVAPAIQSYYESTTSRLDNRDILDVCCGTGILAHHFLENGYSVTGIDLSQPMLDYAIKNNQTFVDAGKAIFYKADARNFHLRKSFGLVVSTFDALNHLENEAELFQCFQCVYQHTSSDGIFIFDLNTAVGLNRWSSIHVDDTDPEIFLVNQGFLDQERGRAWMHITGFIRQENGSYERFEETAFNTIFLLEAVRLSLIKAGFSTVYFSLSKDLSIPVDAPELESRIFVIAQR